MQMSHISPSTFLFNFQEHQDTLEEVRYLRLSAKRSADQRDQPDKEELSTDAAESNRLLRKQNSELKHSVGGFFNDVSL